MSFFYFPRASEKAAGLIFSCYLLVVVKGLGVNPPHGVCSLISQAEQLLSAAWQERFSLFILEDFSTPCGAASSPGLWPIRWLGARDKMVGMVVGMIEPG